MCLWLRISARLLSNYCHVGIGDCRLDIAYRFEVIRPVTSAWMATDHLKQKMIVTLHRRIQRSDVEDHSGDNCYNRRIIDDDERTIYTSQFSVLHHYMSDRHAPQPTTGFPPNWISARVAGSAIRTTPLPSSHIYNSAATRRCVTALVDAWRPGVPACSASCFSVERLR